MLRDGQIGFTQRRPRDGQRVDRVGLAADSDRLGSSWTASSSTGSWPSKAAGSWGLISEAGHQAGRGALGVTP